MKLLYYASYILVIPFHVTALLLASGAWVFSECGNWIKDNTTNRAWRVLHLRKCQAAEQERKRA